jgi:hypothetical protein
MFSSFGGWGNVGCSVRTWNGKGIFLVKGGESGGGGVVTGGHVSVF